MKKLMLFAALLIAACTKEGPTGPAGTNGTNGNANVQWTEAFVQPSDWALSGSEYFYNIGVSPYLPNGAPGTAVNVYLSSVSSNGPWAAMPITGAFVANDFLTYQFYTNTVQLDYFNGAGAPSVDLYFNIVIIPPAIMKKHPGTNWKDSRAVSELPEVSAALKAQKGGY